MFGTKKQSFLGVDFGMSRIKAVEVTLKDGAPHLSNYGEVSLSDSENGQNGEWLQAPEDRVRAMLSALLGKMKPESESAYVAMPGFSGLITLIELPKMSESELENAVKFEAQRYVPAPLSEVVLSWDVVSKTIEPVAPTVMEVLLVAALQKEVDKYERYIDGSSLRMEMLELETFSLVRSLITDQENAFLIVDIGSRSTNLVLVQDGYIKVNRNLNAGGHDITVTLAEILNIARDRAETIKMSEKDFINTRESAVLFPSLEMVTNEAKRMLGAFTEKNKGVAIKGIILSGGASRMKGVEAYFSRMFGAPAVIGDPWAKIFCDDRLQPSIAKLGPAYSVAVGLALAGLESRG
jgi:type IV pilus assembly protein PilM